MTHRLIAACVVALCAIGPPAGAMAQRALHWDNVEVAVHPDAEGRLNVAEAKMIWGFGEFVIG